MADAALFRFLLRMGDNALVLGHRISEWCGHAPSVEEDIALANVALDLIGQTRMWLSLAAEVEGRGRSEDDLAFLRDAWDFRNFLLVEQPNGDFGQTIMRQCLFDVWHLLQLGVLGESSEPRIAEIAQKALKEVTYHCERSAGTVIGLGDGTEESHGRMQAALNGLWRYSGEMFVSDETDAEMAARGIAPEPGTLRDAYVDRVDAILDEATLVPPETNPIRSGGRGGIRHSEHLGHMLAEMQFLQRAYPGAEW